MGESRVCMLVTGRLSPNTGQSGPPKREMAIKIHKTGK